jgi:ribosomal-protein-alanine N-acetyltransferase
VTDDAVPLGPGDLEACLELDRRALGQLWSREQWARELEEPARPGLGIREQGQLLALASGWLVADELHITAVAVDPMHRRRGLGARVLSALLREAVRRGAVHATLEVAAANAAARALYAGAGFQTAGIRRAYYRNGDDALIQWLRLDDADPVRITGHS